MPSTATDRISGISTSTAIKSPCRYTTTGNITLSGLAVQGGGGWAAPLTAEDRIFVQSQTNGIDNGIWLAGEGTWQRARDFDGARDVVHGTLVPVYADGAGTYAIYKLDTNNPIVIGTTSLSFSPASDFALSANLANDIDPALGAALVGYRGGTVADALKQVNHNWMGFFGTWQNGNAFKVRSGAREIGCSGATFARTGFADEEVTMYHIKGVYQPAGIRIQRNNLNASTASATMVMNLSQSETKPLLGKNICLQLHALKAAGWTGTSINVRLQYSKEPQQPIVRSDGAYTSGHVVLIEDDIALTTDMPASSQPYSVAGLLPEDAIQAAIVVTVPWGGSAGLDDYVEIEGCFLTLGAEPCSVIQETFSELIAKAKTRYQTTYPYSAPRGATSKAGAIRVTAVNTSTASAAVATVRLDPPMAVVPQVLMQSPLSGTENRWENETTGVFVNGLPHNLSDQGFTLQNNGAVAAGDVLLCHWTARCVF